MGLLRANELMTLIFARSSVCYDRKDHCFPMRAKAMGVFVDIESHFQCQSSFFRPVIVVVAGRNNEISPEKYIYENPFQNDRNKRK